MGAHHSFVKKLYGGGKVYLYEINVLYVYFGNQRKNQSVSGEEIQLFEIRATFRCP